MQRLTLSMLRDRIDRINKIDNINPKLALETWNPGDGRWYGIEVAGQGVRLHTAKNIREAWAFLDGLTWGLWDWKHLPKNTVRFPDGTMKD